MGLQVEPRTLDLFPLSVRLALRSGVLLSVDLWASIYNLERGAVNILFRVWDGPLMDLYLGTGITANTTAIVSGQGLVEAEYSLLGRWALNLEAGIRYDLDGKVFLTIGGGAHYYL